MDQIHEDMKDQGRAKFQEDLAKKDLEDIPGPSPPRAARCQPARAARLTRIAHPTPTCRPRTAHLRRLLALLCRRRLARDAPQGQAPQAPPQEARRGALHDRGEPEGRRARGRQGRVRSQEGARGTGGGGAQEGGDDDGRGAHGGVSAHSACALGRRVVGSSKVRVKASLVARLSRRPAPRLPLSISASSHVCSLAPGAEPTHSGCRPGSSLAPLLPPTLSRLSSRLSPSLAALDLALALRLLYRSLTRAVLLPLVVPSWLSHDREVPSRLYELVQHCVPSCEL